MKTVKDLREKREGIGGRREEKDSHPSYGMASISHISTGGPGIQLFGSGIKHNHFIQLSIKHAVRYRDKYGEHYFGEDQITQVYLSAAQFTGLMTRSNTPGVPCTINFIQNEGHIENAPEHNIKTELYDDLKDKYKELAEKIKTLQNEIEEDLKGSVKAATKKKIRFAVNQIHNDVSSNMAYLLKCQTERLEEVGTQIIAEAESAMNSMIRNAGLEKLKDQIKTIKPTTKLKRIVKNNDSD